MSLIPHFDETNAQFLERCTDSGNSKSDCMRIWSDKRSKIRRYDATLISPVLTAKEFTEQTGIAAIDVTKDIIRVGNFNGDEVTAKMLSQAVKNFKAFERNQQSIPLLKHHSEPGTHPDTVGYLANLELRDDTLWATFTIRGTSNVEYAQVVNQVSIEYSPEGIEYLDGTTYKGMTIVAVALTGNPAVNKQEGFRSLKTELHSKRDKMLNKEELKRLSDILGEEVESSENALDQIEAKVKSLQSKPDMSKQYLKAQEQIEQLEKRAIPVVDSDLKVERYERCVADLEQLSAKGIVPSSKVDEIKTLMLGSKEKPNDVFLSTVPGMDTYLARYLIQLWNKFPTLVKTGEQSGPQIILHDRGLSGQTKEDQEAVTRKMVAFAGGKS